MTDIKSEDILVQSWGGIIVYTDDEEQAEALKAKILEDE